ncbi:hypothetical protein AA13595_0051 [Gluconacetobacter johannae DSM 13595]|uniref:Helix-turn-helix transcriptional regulator n=1 Tax=Gluconacetobacter johannae TaxID=112140 RepID=A0A7W4J8P1_9PROT|nr:helix-turn-helix transcriptional regulator [Gluconacetobacter johannae]MBB2176746.1 helix-turn-helix transcriptional regulator [Gluconacetobacter johannae]GBQ79533.1 hypothetical protein AA13595_0051 [Gluconacetobacter johannae DSM 13595]
MKRERKPEDDYLYTRPLRAGEDAAGVGEAIAAIRKRMGWTQQQLADALRVSQSTITDWERGKTRPSGRIAQRLVKALGDEIRPYLRAPAPLASERDARIFKPDFHDRFDDLSRRDQFDIFAKRMEDEYKRNNIEISLSDFSIDAITIWFRLVGFYSRTSNAGFELRVDEAIEEQVSYHIEAKQKEDELRRRVRQELIEEAKLEKKPE